MQFDTSKYLEYLKPQSFGNHIIHIEETSSTNDEVWNHMTNHNDIIVITDKQTNGRGRRNNKWFSLESKSLTFSIGLIKKNKNNNLSPLIASLAICKSINQLSSMNVKIKWPNDIVINNKKIAGILIESKMIRGNIILNIGIGVNVNLNIEDITKSSLKNISSMYIETDKIYNREHLLSEIIKSFDQYSTRKDENIIKSWLKYCSHINEKVLFHSNGEKINGIFQGINSKGYAIIQMGNIIKEFSSGVIKL